MSCPHCPHCKAEARFKLMNRMSEGNFRRGVIYLLWNDGVPPDEIGAMFQPPYSEGSIKGIITYLEREMARQARRWFIYGIRETVMR